MRKIPRILLLAAIFLCSDLAAQGTLPDDPAAFVKETSKLLNETKRDDSKETAGLLKANFEGNKFGATQWNTIITTSNQLLSQGFRVYPHLENYLRAVNNSVASSIAESKFLEWNSALVEVISNSKKGDAKGFQRYIDFSVAYFQNKDIMRSNTKVWSVDGGLPIFKYEENMPKVVFTDVNFRGATSGDSSSVFQKTGIYLPSEEKWQGKNGKITWANAGLDPNDVYATFDFYEVDLTKSEFSVDSAMLYYGTLLKEPMLGKLTNKLLINKSTTNRYPQFQTYKKEIEIPNIIENVNYKGGFEIGGSTIYGYGDQEHKAELIFLSPQGKILARSKAKFFLIEKGEKIASQEAEVAIYMGTDSIYHPNLNLKFRIPEKELSGTTGSSPTSKSGFLDSYHQMEMKVERFIWNLNKPEVQFSIITAGEQNPAIFESTNLFEKKKFENYQAALSYNPIGVIKRYSEQYNTRELNANNVAKAFNASLSVEQIRRVLYQMVEDGFILYDQESETIYVKEKVFTYINANAKLIDYDVIKIESRTNNVNAVFNLETREMAVTGVEEVGLSNVQFVKVFPKGKNMELQKNRDMEFDGTVFGGRLDFFGRDYKFDYDKFQIDLNKLDSMTINIPATTKEGAANGDLLPLNTSFENLTGTLYIDKPTNKSGKEKNLQYPIFENRSPSFAYYDNNSVHKNVYKRDKFYYEIDPFTLDSLNSFSIGTQQFTGTLHSAGIFPPIKENLVIMDDYSMGTRTRAPADGYKIYGGKGKYYELIELSNQGLKGKGRFTYLNTEVNSNDITFFPDSLNAHAEKFINNKGTLNGIGFPSISGENVLVHWIPYGDTMWIKMKDKPFQVFDNYGTMAGNLRLTPKGMYGEGTVDWKDATLASEDFKFGLFSLTADTSSLKIKAIDTTKIAFNLPNVNSNITLDVKQGKFRSNEKGIPTELPYNQYQTTMNEFEWDMVNRIIQFNPPKDNIYSIFASTRPEQKGLFFNAKSGSYDMNTYVIVATGVPYIDVADVHIIPGDGKIIVEADAKMQQLTNAKIKVDSVQEYFNIYDATLDIISKEDFKGTGKYDYVNNSGNSQVMNFTQLGVKKAGDTLYTFGVATVLDTQHFLIDPKIFFKGEASMNSKNEFLTFDGVSRLDINDTSKIKTDWFRMKNEVDPKAVMLQASNTTNESRDSIYNGIHLQSDSTNLYATLGGTKTYRRDATIFRADGIVTYNKDTKEFLAGDRKKIKAESKLGNIIKYNNDNGGIYAEGKTNLGLDFGMTKMSGGGVITKGPHDTTFYFDLINGFKLHLTKEVMDMMVNDLTTLTYASPDLDAFNDTFQTKLSQFIGDPKLSEKFLVQLNKTGDYAFPAEMDINLVLTDLKLVWDSNTGTYRSTSGTVGLVSVGGKKVGKKVKGYVEYGMRRQGDFFNIYFETDMKDWYFISYQENLVQVLSSNVLFNDLVMDIKPDDRRFKGKDDQFVAFAISNPSKKENFIDRMRYYLSGQNN